VRHFDAKDRARLRATTWAAAWAAGPGSALGDVVEDLLKLGLHLCLGVSGHLGENVSRAMDQATLAQRPVEHDLSRADQARSAIADDQQRVTQAPSLEAPEEPGPAIN